MVFKIGGLFNFLVLGGPEVLKLLLELLLLLLMDVLIGELVLRKLSWGGLIGGLNCASGSGTHHLIRLVCGYTIWHLSYTAYDSH